MDYGLETYIDYGIEIKIRIGIGMGTNYNEI